MSHRTTVHLESKEQQIKLAEIAASLGLVTSRGVGSGYIGSVSELNKAIADGRVIVQLAKEKEPQ